MLLFCFLFILYQLICYVSLVCLLHTCVSISHVFLSHCWWCLSPSGSAWEGCYSWWRKEQKTRICKNTTCTQTYYRHTCMCMHTLIPIPTYVYHSAHTGSADKGVQLYLRPEEGCPVCSVECCRGRQKAVQLLSALHSVSCSPHHTLTHTHTHTRTHTHMHTHMHTHTRMKVELLNKHLFLTAKPVIYLINLSERDYTRKKNKWWVVVMVVVVRMISNFKRKRIYFKSRIEISKQACEKEERKNMPLCLCSPLGMLPSITTGWLRSRSG